MFILRRGRIEGGSGGKMTIRLGGLTEVRIDNDDYGSVIEFVKGDFANLAR